MKFSGFLSEWGFQSWLSTANNKMLKGLYLFQRLDIWTDQVHADCTNLDSRKANKIMHAGPLDHCQR